MSIVTIVAVIFVLLGVFFFTTATIGLLRFPDFYCRAQSTGKGDTLGILLTMVGFALYNLNYGFSPGNILLSIKLIVIAVFIFLAGPMAIHVLFRSAFENNILPWTKDGKPPVVKWPEKQEVPK
jgi:multicomponent Na+:H+ antiporter subunit G